MRPLHLKLERFLGLERVELEFPSNLFVIVGPNGAGKSSLLEAMYFALYGRGIRSKSGKKELIHRGNPDKALRVQLEFAVSGKRFRVTREYSVKYGGVAYLERYEGERWKPLASGEQGVNEHIEELLGCDALTFRSSVFLPQGETLAFVEASSADRFRTLSSLFGLDILDRIREEVRDRLKVLEGELGPLREKLRLLEAEDLEGEEIRLRGEEAALQERLAALQKRVEVLRGRLERVRKFQEVLEGVQECTKRIEALEKRREELRRLVEEDEATELARRIHEDFEKPWLRVAELVSRVTQEEEEERERLRKTESALAETEAELAKLLEREVSSRQSQKELEVRVREVEERGEPLFKEVSKLKEELALWEERERELKMRIAGLLAEERQLREEEKTCEKALQEKEALLARAEEAYTKIEEALQVLDELLPEEQRRTQELERLKMEWQRLRGEMAKLDERARKLQEEKESVGSRLEALEARREDCEARYRQGVKVFVLGELEEEWRQEGVCPVCGSRVPFPEGERNRVDIVALEKEYRGFHEERTALLSRREHLEREIEEVLREKEEKGAELERVQREGEALSREVQKLRQRLYEALVLSGYPEREKFSPSRFREWVRAKGKVREELRKDVEARRREFAALRERLLVLEDKRREEEKRCAEVQTGKEKVRRELEPKRTLFSEYCASLGISEEDFPEFVRNLRNNLGEAEQEVVRLETEVRAKREHLDFLRHEVAHLAERVKKREGEWESLIREADHLRRLFLDELLKNQWDEKMYRRFLERTPGTSRVELHRLEGELVGLRKQKTEREREKEHLKRALGFAEDTVKEELLKLEEELRSSEEEMNHLLKRLGEIREGLRQNEEKKKEWSALKVVVGEKSRTYETHAELQRALEIGGFKNYLLRMLFSRLEEESSRILLGLSGGRYALRMQMHRGMADIAVLDRRFGGGERLPEECSGGEKTLIALALALALSSLRLEERYARRTECLFIDEGFSTLDREHLDLVADAIFRLSREGKMVGVVTHDPDFAGYFPIQLEVREGTVRWKRNEGLGI